MWCKRIDQLIHLLNVYCFTARTRSTDVCPTSVHVCPRPTPITCQPRIAITLWHADLCLVFSIGNDCNVPRRTILCPCTQSLPPLLSNCLAVVVMIDSQCLSASTSRGKGHDDNRSFARLWWIPTSRAMGLQGLSA